MRNNRDARLKPAHVAWKKEDAGLETACAILTRAAGEDRAIRPADGELVENRLIDAPPRFWQQLRDENRIGPAAAAVELISEIEQNDVFVRFEE